MRSVLFSGRPTSSFEPSTFVDISDYQSQKEQAIEHHESQVEFLEAHVGIDAEFGNVLSGIWSEAEALGKRVGVRYAKWFVPLHERQGAS